MSSGSGNHKLMNMKSNKADILVFLEFIDEAEVFLERYEKEIAAGNGDIAIVSFHPLVKSYLLKERIKATDSFHFCPTESHQKLLCLLDDNLSDIRLQCNITDENGVTLAYVDNLIFRLRAIISHILYRIEVITNAAVSYRPKILVSVGSQQPSVARSISVERSERYLSAIVAQICANYDIAHQNLILDIQSDDRAGSRQQWRQTLHTLFSVMINCFRRQSKNLVVAPGLGHGMGEVLSDLVAEKGDNFKVAVMQHLPRKQAWERMLSRYTKHNGGSFGYVPCNAKSRFRKSKTFEDQKARSEKDLFSIMDDWNYRCVSYGDWLKNKYIHGLLPEVIDATYDFSMNLNKYLNQFRPVFVLSQHSRMSTAVLGELCLLKNVPSMILPHGSFSPIQDEYSRMEWVENALGLINTPYQYVALQTPLAKEFISDVRVKSEPVITGPLLFGRKIRPSADTNELKRRYAKDSDKIILHAGTPKHRSATRFLNYETLDEYIDGMISLANAVSQLDGVHLIIRFRSIDGLTPEDLKVLLPMSGSCSIASGGDFASYLYLADLLVSFSSTTIEEALQNDIPVLLYNKYNRYRHITGTELSPAASKIEASAVYNVNREDDLLFGLQWILANHLSQWTSSEKLFSKYQFAESDCTALSTVIKQAVRVNSHF